MKRADVVQVTGIVLTAVSVGARCLWVGGLVGGILTIVYGVAMARPEEPCSND